MRQLTLGEVIEALEKAKPDAYVQFGFGDLVPDGLDSYRGYYNELALAYKPHNHMQATLVESVLADLRAAVGSVFQGYKGGDFQMTRSTPIWVANYGDATDTALVQVDDRDYVVILQTWYQRNY